MRRDTGGALGAGGRRHARCARWYHLSAQQVLGSRQLSLTSILLTVRLPTQLFSTSCAPLSCRGKLLNVRDASTTQVTANAEIQNIKQILGLQHGKV